MDALSLLTKFLREMSLGLLFAILTILLVITTPAIYFWRYVKLVHAREKGVSHASIHGRQSHRSDHSVVNKGKRGRLHVGFS